MITSLFSSFLSYSQNIFTTIASRTRYACYAIVSLCILLYSKTIFFGLVYHDDNIFVLSQQHLLSDWHNISQIFTREVFLGAISNYYRPLLNLSFMVDAHIGHFAPVVFHLTNVVLHAAAACVVYLLLIRLTGRRNIAFLFACMFSIHPVLAQAVAWIPGRNDELFALSIVPAFLAGLNVLEPRGRKLFQYFAHFAFFAAALLIKEAAIVFPVVFCSYVVLIRREKMYRVRLVLLAAGWAALIALWQILRASVTAPASVMISGELLQNVLHNLPAIIIYFGKLFIPFNLSVYPIIADSSLVYGMIAIAVMVAALLLSGEIRWRYVLFGLLWFLLFTAPTLAGDSTLLGHRMYVPIIGIMIAAAEIDLARFFSKTGLSLIAAGAGIFFLFSAYHFSDQFRDRYRYWQNAVETSPHSAEAHTGMAKNYLNRDDIVSCEKELVKAIQLNPAQVTPRCLLAIVYWYQQKYDEAEAHFKTAIQQKHMRDSAYSGYAGFCYSRGRYAEAESLLKKAVEYNVYSIAGYKKLIQFYYNQHRYPESDFYRRFLKDRWKIEYIPRETKGLVLEEDMFL